MKLTVMAGLSLLAFVANAEEVLPERRFLELNNAIASGAKVDVGPVSSIERKSLIDAGRKELLKNTADNFSVIALSMLGDQSSAEAIAAHLEETQTIVGPDHPEALNGGPLLVAAFAPRIQKEEPLSIAISDIVVYPVSFGAAYNMISTIANCSEFSADVLAWARSYENADIDDVLRLSLREWWANNGPAVSSGRYSDVRPGRPRATQTLPQIGGTASALPKSEEDTLAPSPLATVHVSSEHNHGFGAHSVWTLLLLTLLGSGVIAVIARGARYLRGKRGE